MFSSTLKLCGLRPRHIKFTPPPLVRRSGDFRCPQCQFWWQSNYVWVTKMSGRCYQGQQCERCGATSKPYFITERPRDEIIRAGGHAPRARPEPGRKHVILKHSQMNRRRGGGGY